ncbi:Arc family DNA-binding protein [Stenotrophomonas maltophilia]|uniref:Arc family DNA-binding protein n=1 Tax=Stenotrophomonas maltophilia TaxID=40324 RepID=UPI003F854132
MNKKPATQVQPQDKFVVRFPDGLRDEIADAAKASGRSMNAEIVTRLEWSLEAQLLDQVEQLHRNLDAVRSMASTAASLKVDIDRYAEGDRQALVWLLGTDGALEEETALSAARLALETMEERLHALRASIATTYQAIQEDGREPQYYTRKF